MHKLKLDTGKKKTPGMSAGDVLLLFSNFCIVRMGKLHIRSKGLYLDGQFSFQAGKSADGGQKTMVFGGLGLNWLSKLPFLSTYFYLPHNLNHYHLP